jgi:hypothetical protein
MSKKSIIYAFALFSLLTILLINLSSSREVDCTLDKPIGLWKFNEVINGITFESCHGDNATMFGDYLIENGKYNNSIQFDGVTTYGDAGTSMNGTYIEFSASIWANITQNINIVQSLIRRGFYYTDEFYDVIQVGTGYNDFTNNGMSNGNVDSQSISSVADGNWHHIVTTFNGSTGLMTMYIDGVFVSNTSTIQTQILETQMPLTFGVNYDNGWALIGQLDEISFFNKALSEREVKDLFNPLKLNPNLSIVLYVPQYPYVDLNTIYPLKAKLFNNQNEVTDGLLVLGLTELNGTITSIELPYNAIDGYYEVSLLFNQIANYSFIIEANAYDLGYVNATGMFLVRNPYYVNVSLFTNNGLTNYINDFGFVTAEYLGNQRINPILENFVHPLSDNRFVKPTFHSQYFNGNAQLKLYEKDDYVFRFIDGIVVFNGTYSQPNITKSYGSNIYLGTIKLSGQNTTIQFVLQDRELHPYRYLANWLLFIVLALSFIVGIFIFFLMPDKPYIALVFTLLLSVGSVAMRIFIWFWMGF